MEGFLQNQEGEAEEEYASTVIAGWKFTDCSLANHLLNMAENLVSVPHELFFYWCAGL